MYRSRHSQPASEAGHEFISYAKKAVSQYEILEDKYLSKDKEKAAVFLPMERSMEGRV